MTLKEAKKIYYIGRNCWCYDLAAKKYYKVQIIGVPSMEHAVSATGHMETFFIVSVEVFNPTRPFPFITELFITDLILSELDLISHALKTK